MISISYRHGETLAETRLIVDKLSKKFGKRSVFWDHRNVSGGDDIQEVIQAAWANSQVVVVVIGPNWTGELNGERRINDPEDPVHQEVAQALAARIPICPILVKGAHRPKAEDLPPDIRKLASLLAVRIDVGDTFNAGIESLTKCIRGKLRRRESRLWNWLTVLALMLAACAVIMPQFNKGVHVIARGSGSQPLHQIKPYEEAISLTQPGILFVTAIATGRRESENTLNASVMVETLLDKKPLAANQEFEAKSSNQNFYATATSSTYLPRGEHVLTVKASPENLAVNEEAKLEVDWLVIASKPKPGE